MSMNAKEFKKTAVRCGYCSEETAAAYIRKNPKSEYTDEDIQAVFRIEEATLSPWTTKDELRDANF